MTTRKPTGNTTNSVAELLKNSEQRLTRNSHSPRLDAEILLAHALRKGREFLYAHADQVIESETLLAYSHLLERRVQGEPIAYITGSQEFWSLKIHVTPDVLIPRNDTELLIEQALTCLAGNTHRQPCILDMGTGSGAIALALAHELPASRITATDISPAALQVACDNAQRLEIKNIDFLHGDWLEAVSGMTFDLIVSNPPYVAEHDPLLEQNVATYEPRGSLISDNNGLEDIGRIINAAGNHLTSGGYLILEHGYKQAEHIRNLLQKQGYTDVRTHKDLSRQDRCTSGRLPTQKNYPAASRGIST